MLKKKYITAEEIVVAMLSQITKKQWFGHVPAEGTCPAAAKSPVTYVCSSNFEFLTIQDVISSEL